MPLYIDYHQLEGDLTIEDVRTAHLADLSNQDQYGVRYIQLWVNKRSAMVFCLMEGPDAESCVACHLASHGNTPCNIQEVEEGFFKLYMGENLLTDDNHMTLTEEGTFDTANRSIMVIDLLLPVTPMEVQDQLSAASELKKTAANTVIQFKGRILEHPFHNRLVAVFNTSSNAYHCAMKIQVLLHPEMQYRPAFRIAINNDQPLTENEGFSKATIICAHWMCTIAGVNQIVLSSTMKNLHEVAAGGLSFPSSIRVLSKPQESFIKKIFAYLENNMKSETISIKTLGEHIGMSRTQLYRKTMELSGKSPHKLITDFRMIKAMGLLGNMAGNISEIAFEVGFTNPSYFSKQFRKSYGYAPSEFSKYFV